MKAYWTCPYCGFTSNIEDIDTVDQTAFLAYCNSEKGGCDGQVVIKPMVRVTVAALAIDGEKERANHG